MKYIKPSIAIDEAQAAEMLAESLPIIDKTVDGSQAPTKEDNAWDTWEEVCPLFCDYHIAILGETACKAKEQFVREVWCQYFPPLKGRGRGMFDGKGDSPSKNRGELRYCQWGVKTPRAGMTNAARGDCHRRTRKLPTPHAAFSDALKGIAWRCCRCGLGCGGGGGNAPRRPRA